MLKNKSSQIDNYNDLQYNEVITQEKKIATLAELSKDEEWRVRRDVAKNKNKNTSKEMFNK